MSKEDIKSVNISAEERAQLMASIEDLENEASETPPAGKEVAEGSDGDPENQPKAGEAAGETESNDDPGEQVAGSRPVMIPKARFDDAVNKERERAQKAIEDAEAMRARLKALEDRVNLQHAIPEAPEKDFAKEKADLRKKYDDGDIDAEQYEVERDKIVIAETAYLVKRDVAVASAAAAAADIEADWNTKITAWVETNAEFMANPIREQAVASLLEKYGKDGSMSNADLLARVEKEAFEAFNYKPSTPAAPANPNASRNAADAKAASAASSLGGTPAGGEGNRSTEGKSGIEGIKQGEFNKLSRAEQVELLGGEAAL